MKHFKFFVVIMLMAAGAAYAADAYWVSFSENFGGGRKFVMKIDKVGNVLISPVQVAGPAEQFSGPTAISKQGSNLYFYTTADFVNNAYKIRRLVIDTSTFNILDDDVSNLGTSDPDFLQLGQLNPDHLFLAYEKAKKSGNPQPEAPQREDNGSLRGVELNLGGLPINNKWRLSPRTDGGNDQGSVSEDGRMALSNDHDSPPDKVYAQSLNSLSQPARDPKVITNYEDTFVDIGSVDVSNTLSNGLRFAVYQVSNREKVSEPPPSSILLQRISDTTGARVGTPYILNTDFRFTNRQVLAIDPDGHFVLFTSMGSAPVDVAAPANGCEDLVFQALNSNGTADGDPISLVEGCDLEIFSISGIDIDFD